MYDIVGKRNLWFAISLLLTIPGLIFIFLGGRTPSIDFTGGTEWEVRYAEQPTAAEMTTALNELGHEEILVTELSEGFLRIRTEPIDLIPPEGPDPSPSAPPGACFNVEVDALFGTARLTVIGFSIHDTIVVFDRIRENRVRHSGESFGAIVNHSILQTAGRSTITSLKVVVPLAALLLLG